MDVPAAPLIGYCLNISRLTLETLWRTSPTIFWDGPIESSFSSVSLPYADVNALHVERGTPFFCSLNCPGLLLRYLISFRCLHPRVFISTSDTLTPSIGNSSSCQDRISSQPSDYMSNMTSQRASLVNETMKNRIFHLYIIEDLSLNKLRSRMKEMFDFDRT
jgi:hypothetical protein